MEAKLLVWIFTGTGIVSYIGAILLNIGTWKADILFLLGAAFLLLKFIRLTIKTWQDFRRGEIEIKALKNKKR